jgi:hypothetical protein
MPETNHLQSLRMPILSRSKLKQNRLSFASHRSTDLQDDLSFAAEVCSSADKHLRNCVILLRWALAREIGISPEKIHADDPTDILARLIGDVHWIGYWFAAQAINADFFDAIWVDTHSANPKSLSWEWDWETLAEEHPFTTKKRPGMLVKDWIRPVAVILARECTDQTAIENTIKQYENNVRKLLL